MDNPSPNFQTVCRIGDIPEGEARMFAVAETMIGVFNGAFNQPIP
jgi:hypothetical protein